MTDLRAGDLRHRIAIQRRETGTSAIGTRGQSTETWHTIEHRWAKVETLSSREAEKARQLFAESTHRMTIRKPTSYVLDMSNRIQFEHETYGIGSIVEASDSRDDLVLLCARRQ